MFHSGERDDLFFDSKDSFSSRDFAGVSEEGMVCEELGTGFWRNELISVQERRGVFFQKMGFVEIADLSDPSVDDSVVMEVEWVRESSVASSSSSDVSPRGVETVVTPIDCGREENGKANSMVEEFEIKPPSRGDGMNKVALESSEAEDHLDKNKVVNWWRKMATKRRAINAFLSIAKAEDRKAPKVQVKKKRVKELSALYTGQEFQAHKGVIWAAKLSPDGQFLATGGQDGVVRVWHITSTACREKSFAKKQGSPCCRSKGRNSFRREKKLHVPVVIPDTVFHIEESPFQVFHGHTGDVLDLDWSDSNRFLSSSADNTVRLWRVGSSDCVHVFRHSDFVTCVQFNPIDDGYFISGSVDGKFRLWGVSEGRVIDWDDVREPVTAISYQPDGQGLVVGSFSGTCRFYKASGGSLQLISQIQVDGSKRSSGNRITRIQFLQEDSQKVMITSEDSRVRVIDKTNIIRKYRGLYRSGCQMSASFTPNRRHIISIGEDARVYLWDYDNDDSNSVPQTPPPSTPSSRHAAKSVRSCEYFHSQGVSVVVPCSSSSSDGTSDLYPSSSCCSCSRARPGLLHSRTFTPASLESSLLVSLSNWFSPRKRSAPASATWPEEMLSAHDPRSRDPGCDCGRARSRTWGLVIVTGSCDGTMRVFHNYGLPIRVHDLFGKM